MGKIPWRRKWLPTPVFLSGESRGQRKRAGYSLWGQREPNTTEHRHTHTHTHTKHLQTSLASSIRHLYLSFTGLGSSSAWLESQFSWDQSPPTAVSAPCGRSTSGAKEAKRMGNFQRLRLKWVNIQNPLCPKVRIRARLFPGQWAVLASHMTKSRMHPCLGQRLKFRSKRSFPNKLT